MERDASEVRTLRCDVLDDDAGVREVICGILNRSGVAFRSFATLRDQLAAMAEQHPDLLFLDVKLADADAIEAIRQLHAMGYHGHIQVVSGLDPRRLSEIYAMMERYGYGSLYPISKPFRSAAIRSTLDHLRATRLPSIGQNSVPEVQVVAGWLSTAAPRIGALVVQPHLMADPDAPDLLRLPGSAAQAIADILAVAQRDPPDVDIWLHMSLDGALDLPLASMRALDDPSQNAGLSIVVPLEQATTAPLKFHDLHTRLSVYDVGFGLFAARLDGKLMSTLGGGLVDRLVLGEACIAQMIGNATNALLADKIASSCQDLGIALAAICARGGPEETYLRALGITALAPPVQHMSAPIDLVPDAYLVEQQQLGSALPARETLLDFEGRELLSDREVEIVSLTANGLSAKEAARQLGLSHRTVEVHRSNIFNKLGVKNVAQLTRLVFGLK